MGSIENEMKYKALKGWFVKRGGEVAEGRVKGDKRLHIHERERASVNRRRSWEDPAIDLSNRGSGGRN